MVCQKGSQEDHKIFPIMFQKNGDMIKADGTTLGADDGFGVAALLALMSDTTIKHGPLELLFTTGEESGFIGATAFDFSQIKSRKIYNIDSEEEGILTVGSAGGVRMEIKMPFDYYVQAGAFDRYLISVSGLQGGHSGVDINRGRENAIRVLAKVLAKISHYYLESLNGGSAINTIPRSAEATVCTRDKAFITNVQNIINQLSFSEKPTIVVEKIQLKNNGKFLVMNQKDTKKMLALIKCLPNGVIKMEDGSTSVRTSNNVAIINQSIRLDISNQIDSMDGNPGLLSIKCLLRSSSNRDIDSVLTVIKNSTFNAAENSILNIADRYPPWEPRFDSPLARKTIDTYQELFNKKMKIQTIHAGLECAVIAQKIPDAQVVSFGPTITGAHTPNETVEISSVNNYWKLLVALLNK
jgi:dipeptidase D